MKKFKNLAKITDKIAEGNPLQKKKIINQLKKYDNKTLSDLEKIALDIIIVSKKNKFTIKNISKFYNDLCIETMQEQLYLKKFNTYRSIKEKKSNLKLYNSNFKMKKYILALMLTQIYWNSHVQIFKWYKKKIKNLNLKYFLEIGSGHGLLSKELIKKKNLKGVICDISQQSLNFTKNILGNFIKSNKIEFKKIDFFDLKPNKKFDFVVMGEVIEHVDNPIKFLKKVKTIITKDGKIFISTCANCAQVDNIYHFKSIEQIRNLIKKTKLRIISELISPSEKIKKDKWKKEKISINYCAILENEKN